MDNRLKLHGLLCRILGSDNVYFQPPNGYMMSYPCIVYEKDNNKTIHANNKPYLHNDRYLVTVIDKDPDSVLPRKIADLPMCKQDRHFNSSNLHHHVFTLYY